MGNRYCTSLVRDFQLTLFLTRELWKAEHIKSYLSEIAVDAKDLDKLLLKYSKALTDKDGPWYTARVR